MKISLLALTTWMVLAVVVSARFSFARTGPIETVDKGGSVHMAESMHEMAERPHRHPLSIERLQKILGLSDDQAQKLRQLRIDYKKQAIRKDADIRIAGLEIHEMLAQKNVAVPQAEKKVQELTSLRGDLTLLRIRSMMRAKEFLNDEQFARFKQIALTHSSYRWRGMRGAAEKSHGEIMWKRERTGAYSSEEQAADPGEKERREAASNN